MGSKIDEKLLFSLSKKCKSESDFTSWYGSEIKKRGWFFHKISDMDIRPKPFDAIMAWDGIIWAIEFKSVWVLKSCHPFRLLRWSSPSKPWSQVKGLQWFQDNWWLSLVIVFNKLLQQYKVIDFKDIDFNTKITFDA